MTSIGWTVHQGKTLLVKHKKLGIWLAPGGHIEEGELPHHAAEREFGEETGIKVKALDAHPTFEAKDTQTLPMPFYIGLHWINKPRGDRGGFCEQHIGICYFVKVLDDGHFLGQKEEVDDIGWFTKPQALKLLQGDLITECEFCFDNFPKTV